MLILKQLLVSIICAELCSAYRILGVFPNNVKSHFIVFDELMSGLVKKGHHVDTVSSYPPTKKLPNYRHTIQINNKLGNPTNNLTFNEVGGDLDVLEYIATVFGNELCEELGNPEILQLVHNPPTDPPYDLLITEIFGAQCFIALGHLLKIPAIGLVSTEPYPWMNDIIANPESLAWVPNSMQQNIDEYMLVSSFWCRLYNVAKTAYMKMIFNYLSSPQDDIIRRYYGPDMPGVRELESKLALILANYHVPLSTIRPSTPALIPVGGLHIRDDNNTALSPDLEKWLTEGKEGFVYVSFGSMLRIESYPKEIVDALLASLGKITPVRVLMKIAEPKELPPKIPENIRTMSWIPQRQILKHPNIRAFISHGGMLGGQEAIYYGVPMIGIPLYADQYAIVNNFARYNICLKFNWSDFSEEKMDKALHEILYNPIYMNSMKRVSQMIRDRPQSPLETACYWVEYVIKYGDESLKSPAMKLSWWQISLLDVYGFLLLCLFVILYITKIAIQKLFLVFSRRRKCQKVNKND